MLSVADETHSVHCLCGQEGVGRLLWVQAEVSTIGKHRPDGLSRAPNAKDPVPHQLYPQLWEVGSPWSPAFVGGKE